MSPAEIESNASLLIIAGSETTATFLSGITYNLLRTPAVLKKLTELVRTTFAVESDITVLKVQQLDYFTACIEEGLRTYPPVPIGLQRVTTAEGNTICNKYVPPNTKVSVPQWASYSSPANFLDPDRFVPERWMKNPPAKYANDNRAVLQPFSVGPRNCIGRGLAYAEMRLILARVLHNFDFELQEDSRNWLSEQKSYGLWEKTPLHVKIIPRKL
ncbi:Cytochrome P450 monooxygenase aclL [Lachnellula suecica]|uniref:Cytochrome P450 monooxygenase aclL n=1 Tax=Lachnellula suecica TaxID=602035 RepID=A0A8T9CEU1_9HELO|nr:Cytochrome P450 monooxygenase aclL [Lachnellula suecica]